MNLNLNYEGFEKYLVNTVDIRFGGGGRRYEFKFDNSYGATVLKHAYSCGSDGELWIVCVVRWLDNYYEALDGDSILGTYIIKDLTNEDVRNLLQRIKDL